jgi:hypothetical protein
MVEFVNGDSGYKYMKDGAEKKHAAYKLNIRMKQTDPHSNS